MKWFLHLRNFINGQTHSSDCDTVLASAATFSIYLDYFFSASEPSGNSMWIA